MSSGSPANQPDPAKIVVSAFYQFAALDDFEQLQEPLLNVCERHEVRGSILLASEGINGTVAGSRSATDALFSWLRSDRRLGDLTTKESFVDAAPFHRMKVRLKKEIVSFGKPVDPTTTVGRYVAPAEWNDLISDPDVLVIDTRNIDEIEVGTFANAVNPRTESFTQFAAYVDENLDPDAHPRVAMFCTGGIRCEKATSYLIEQGFSDVAHLEGGILKYFEEVPEQHSLWQGECFVFDERVSVNHDLSPGTFTLCRGCRHPLDATARTSQDYEEGVSCDNCVSGLSDERRTQLRERHRQVLLAEERGERHIGR